VTAQEELLASVEMGKSNQMSNNAVFAHKQQRALRLMVGFPNIHCEL
jgi:hypothetical protein